jgi:hypothetical protein
MATQRRTLVALLTFASLVWMGAAPPESLHFKKLGFSIQPLEAAAGPEIYQTLIMFLPVSDAFAPNVNVQVQPFKDSIDAYVKISKNQFESVGVQLISESKPRPDTWYFEYTGENQGYRLHWYAKAIATGSSVYLVTATATIGQWGEYGSRLKQCVDSFILDGSPSP